MVNFETFDLNLLRVLDAVLSEQSVSRAARRLNLSQPAVSHSLRRLRRELGDPLIERAGGRMRPTAEGERLGREVHEILLRLRSELSPPAFEPGTTTRRFSIATTDPIALRLGPPLLRRLKDLAPGAQLEIQRLHTVRTTDSLLERRLDLAVSPAGSLPEQLRSTPLITSPWQPTAARDDDTVPDRVTLEEFVRFPHVVVNRARVNGIVDATLAAHGLRRQIGLVVDSDLLIPTAIAGTDLIALCLAPDPDDPRLRMIQLPTAIATTTFNLWWTAAVEGDEAHTWFRNVFLGVVAGVFRSRPGDV